MNNKGINTRNKSFLTDLFLTYSSQFIVLVLHIVIIKLLAIYLTGDGFGAYMVIKRVVGIAFPILTVNLSISLSRFISINETRQNKYLILSLLTLTVITIIVFIVSSIFNEIIAESIFNKKELEYLISPLLLFIYANSVQVVTVGYLRGKHEFRKMNIVIVLFWIIQLIILVTLIQFFTDSLYFLKYYLIVNAIFILIMCGYFIIKNTNFNKETIKRIIGLNIIENIKSDIEFYKYGLYRLPNGFFLAGIFSLPVFYSSNRISLKTAGYIGAIVTIIKMFQIVGNPINRLFLPKISHLKTYSSNKTINKHCKTVIEFIFTFPILLGLLLYYLSPELIKIWFGSDFTIIINYVNILSPFAGLLIGFILIRSVLNGLYTYPYVNHITFFSFLFELILVIITEIFQLGIIGVSISFGGAIFILWFISTWILLKKQKIPVATKNNIISVIWLFIVFLILSVLKNIITINNIYISAILKVIIALAILLSSFLIYKIYNYQWINEMLKRLPFLNVPDK